MSILQNSDLISVLSVAAIILLFVVAGSVYISTKRNLRLQQDDYQGALRSSLRYMANYIVPQDAAVRLSIYLFDSQKSNFYLYVSTGPVSRYEIPTRYERRQGIIGLAWDRLQPVALDLENISEEDFQTNLHLSPEQIKVIRDIKSAVAIPIFSSPGEPIAVLLAESKNPAEISHLSERDTVLAFVGAANFIGVFLDKKAVTKKMLERYFSTDS